MQSTTRLHDGVANAILQAAYLVFYHPRAFHPANGLCKTDSERRDRTIGRFLRWSELTPRRYFLRLDKGDPVEDKALEAHILIEITPVREGIALQLSQAFIIGLAFIGGTQEADVTALIDHEKVLDRVALLRAAVGVLLGLGIGGARDRSLSAIMPKRGGGGTPPVHLAASITAQSSALRTGRRSWCANA
jgi:hypothetical protein